MNTLVWFRAIFTEVLHAQKHHLRHVSYKKELKVTSELYGIRFIDGEEVIDKNNLKDYAPKGPHLSLNGYEKLSNLIIKKIQNYPM